MTREAFAMLCYLTLMDHHGDSYFMAHPDYIEGKRYLLSEGYDAYAALDRVNQEKVLGYLIDWHQPIPKPIEAYEEELLNETIR